MRVRTREEAWREADKLFPTDYMKDETGSENAGYDIYESTLPGCYAWISDLGTSLEVNLPDGKTVRIWIEQPEITEDQIDEALMVVSEAIYEIDDKVNMKCSDILGLEEARQQLYGAYRKARDYCDKFYPYSKLYRKFNLYEA